MDILLLVSINPLFPFGGACLDYTYASSSLPLFLINIKMNYIYRKASLLSLNRCIWYSKVLYETMEHN